MTPLAFVKCLTLGPDVDLHPVFEVGLIVSHEDGEDAEKRWFLPVQGLAFADPTAPGMERFQNEHPQGIAHYQSKISKELGSTNFEEFANQFVEMTRGADLIGDLDDFERLRKMVRSVELLPLWGQSVDLDSLAIGYAMGRGEDVDIVLRSAFEATALGQCRFARELYDGISKRES